MIFKTRADISYQEFQVGKKNVVRVGLFNDGGMKVLLEKEKDKERVFISIFLSWYKGRCVFVRCYGEHCGYRFCDSRISIEIWLKLWSGQEMILKNKSYINTRIRGVDYN